MFEKFDALISEDDKISKDDLMIVLKEELVDVCLNNFFKQKFYET